MSYTHKVNAGSLFTNTRKTKDTHPDRSGTINIEGRLYFIDGWLKQDKNGNPWLSISVKLMDRQPQQEPPPAQQPAPLPVRPPQPKQPGGFEQMDDDKPW